MARLCRYFKCSNLHVCRQKHVLEYEVWAWNKMAPGVGMANMLINLPLKGCVALDVLQYVLLCSINPSPAQCEVNSSLWEWELDGQGVGRLRYHTSARQCKVYFKQVIALEIKLRNFWHCKKYCMNQRKLTLKIFSALLKRVKKSAKILLKPTKNAWEKLGLTYRERSMICKYFLNINSLLLFNRRLIDYMLQNYSRVANWTKIYYTPVFLQENRSFPFKDPRFSIHWQIKFKFYDIRFL